MTYIQRQAFVKRAISGGMLAIATMLSIVQPVPAAAIQQAALNTVPQAQPAAAPLAERHTEILGPVNPIPALVRNPAPQSSPSQQPRETSAPDTSTALPSEITVAAPARAAPQIRAYAPLSQTCTTISVPSNATLGQPGISGNGNRVGYWYIGDPFGTNRDGNVEVFMADVTGGGTVTLTQVTSSTGSILGGFNLWPTLNADGARVAFASDRNLAGGNGDSNFEIFIADANGSGMPTITQITTTTVGVNTAPAISGDGQHIAFASNIDLVPGQNSAKSTEIYMATLSDTTVLSYSQITSSTADIVYDKPSINFSGAMMAYIARSVATSTVYVADTMGGAPLAIGTSSLDVDNHPGISQDGKTVVFVSDYDLDSGKNVSLTPQMFLYVQGQPVTQISHFTNANVNCNPAINGNGLRVACIDDNQRLFLYNVRTGAGQFITDTIATFADPSISSDGQNVAYLENGVLKVTTCPLAHLVVSKVVTPTTAGPGANLTYNIVVTNYGPGVAKNVVLTDVLPTGVTLSPGFTPNQTDNSITTFVGTKVGVAYGTNLHLDGSANAAAIPNNNGYVGTWAGAISPALPMNVLLLHLDGTSTVIDSSGNGLNGTCSTACTDYLTTDGRLQGAATFPGIAADYISVANNNLFNFNYNQDFTLLAWINPSSYQQDTTNVDNDIIAKWGAGPGYPFVIRYYNQTSPNWGKIYAARYDGQAAGNPVIVSNGRLDDGFFHQVIFTRQSGTLYLYVDGVMQGQTTDTTGNHSGCYQWQWNGYTWVYTFVCNTSNTDNLTLGSRNGASNGFKGFVDEFAIFNSGMSASQVSGIYAVQSQAMNYNGTYQSRQMDAGRPVYWNSLSWQITPTLDTGQLPDGSNNLGAVDMTGNTILFHFNEPQNSTVYNDSSSNGYHASAAYYPPTSGVVGKIGNGVGFNGNNQSLYVWNGSYTPIRQNTNTSFSFETWVYLPASVGYQNVYGTYASNYVCPYGCSYQNSGFYLSINNNQIYPQLWTNSFNGSYYNNYYYSFSAGSIPVGQWTYVAATWDGSTLTAYINGKAVGSAATVGSPFQLSGYYGYAIIGASPTDYHSNAFNGSLDELAFYNRALSASEVAVHYTDRASRLQFQVHTCSDSLTCGSYVGPDGTSNTYYDTPVLNNVVSVTVPISVSKNPIFQYRAMFNSVSAVASAHLYTVSVGPIHGPVDTSLGSCAINAPICNLGDMQTGSVAYLSFPAQVGVSVPAGSIANVVNVNTDSDDIDPTTHVATATVFIPRNVILSFSKTVTPTTASAGQLVTYTLVVTNEGTTTANNVLISDTLPPGTWSASSATFNCPINGQLMRCVDNALPGTLTATVQVQGVAQANTNGLVINTAVVMANEFLTPTSATATLHVPVAVDIGITQTASPDPVYAGSLLTYTINVTNSAASIAPNVYITDVLDSKAIFRSGSSGCTVSAGVVTCPLGNLTSPDNRTVTIVVTVTSNTTGTVGNLAFLGTDGSIANPQASLTFVTTTVQTAAHLVLNKSASVGTTANAGTPFQYILNVQNQGPSDAANVIVTDTLPAGINYVSRSSNPSYGLTGVQSGQVVTWTTASLPAGANANLIITATSINISPPLSVTNYATMTSATVDPNPGSNSASLVTIIAPNPTGGINLTAPATCQLNVGCVFTTTAVNSNATLPLTLTYSADEQSTQVVVANSLTSTVAFTWTAPGVKNVSVSAVNPAGTGGTAATTIDLRSDLAISIQAPAQVNASDTIQYTLVFTNYGMLDATNVFITATLSAGQTFGGVASQPGFLTQGAGPTWSVANTAGVMTIGSGYQIVFTATTSNNLPPPSVNTSVIITSSVPDPTSANDGDSATVTINKVGVNSVSITGSSFVVSGSYTFADTVLPVTATLPITYTWAGTNSPSFDTNCSAHTLNSPCTITWAVTGTQQVTVSVQGAVGVPRTSSFTQNIP